MLQALVAKVINFARKIAQTLAHCIPAAPKTRILTGISAVALLSGCAPRHWDALMILAPKDGGQAYHSVVQVPRHMHQGSSDLVIHFDGDVYRGKMICSREGFTTESSGFATGSGGGFATAGGSGSTIANLSSCQATLISGEKSLQCQMSGASEEYTTTAQSVANLLLAVPSLGASLIAPISSYAPIGTGECRTSDGAVYAVQIAEPPKEE